MENFREVYVLKCKELQQEPLPAVLSRVDPSKQHKHPNHLNLSGHNLSLKTCIPIADALRQDILFTKIDFSDSFLGDDGCVLIANSLKSNGVCQEINLRGNNIRADGAAALASMLKVNRSIRKLSLEWNCLGIWESSLQSLSDALTVNNTLDTLDLRNNRINPQGIAILATGLRHNSSLKHLDLRWNNAGLIGGRALLEAVEINPSLVDVELAGNEIPQDIEKAIGIALERHRDSMGNKERERKRILFLDQEFQQLAMTHRQHVEKLAIELEDQGKEYELTRKTLQNQLDSASNEIEKSHNAYRSLETKWLTLVKEAEKEKEKINVLEETLTLERSEHLKIVKGLHQELNNEKDRRARLEEAQAKGFAETTKRMLVLEANLRDLELREDILAKEKHKILQELDKSKRRVEEADTILEEKLKAAEDSFKRKMDHANQVKEDDIRRRELDYEERIRKLDDRLRTSEMIRNKTEQELDEYKSKMISSKMALEQRMNDLEKTIRRDEEERRRDLESQYNNVKRQRDQLQTDYDSLCSKHHNEVNDLEGRISVERKLRQSVEMDFYQYKSEHNEKVVKALTDQNQAYAAELSQIRGGWVAMQESLRSKEAVITGLKDELDGVKEEEIGRMKELESAISTYIRSASSKHAARS